MQQTVAFLLKIEISEHSAKRRDWRILNKSHRFSQLTNVDRSSSAELTKLVSGSGLHSNSTKQKGCSSVAALSLSPQTVAASSAILGTGYDLLDGRSCSNPL